MDIKLKYIRLSLILFLLSFFAPGQSVIAQIYGLKFQGQNVTLDRRTELNLTPGKFYNFKNEFEISFDYKAIRIQPNSNAGLFGYIFRIIDAENNNIDLLSKPDAQVGLNLVLGKSHAIIPISYSEDMIGQWVNLRIKFLLNEDKLVLYTPDSSYVQENMGLERVESFKIIFGANHYNQFKNSDVPSMAIKDIVIYENDKIKYHWPLNEKNGKVATDRIKGEKAQVINPVWLVLPHQNWQKVFEDEFEGIVRVAADNGNGDIFIVGKKQLTIYSTQNNEVRKITYQNTPLFFDINYRTIFNTNDNKIYCYTVDELPFYSLDIDSGKWNESGNPVNFQTKYRHHNSFYREKDNSIYTFGGYGGHQYKNNIFKIDLTDSTKTELPTDNSIYEPRYLSGLAELNDTIHILGGYGSSTGNQLINPHSYFNLIAFSLKTGELVEKFEIPNLLDDMVVGNKMWIDGKTRDYYALVFGKVKFQNQLQLIKGNLGSPEIEMVGDKIPFKFLDIRSFVNLYYMPVQDKLYTYKSYISDSTTQVSIYSINYPPNISLNETESTQKEKSRLILIIILTGLFIAGILVFFIIKRKILKGKLNRNTLRETMNPFSKTQGAAAIKQNKYNLIFFGGFQIFDKYSKDITNKFSPLLKELFLLILLHTHKNDKGISSGKIAEILWNDKSERSARNNRAVNIAKLKGILSDIGECEISKKTGYWKIDFSEAEVKSDYLEFLNITSSQKHLNKEKVYHLIAITEKGPFLSNVDYEWLDKFKAMVSNRILDTLIEFGHSVDVKENADFIIHLADSVFNFDIVNEEAMILKCKAQNCLGKHSLAKATYEKFCEEYKIMYGQNYEKGFTTILKS